MRMKDRMRSTDEQVNTGDANEGAEPSTRESAPLREGLDYYFEGGLLVFTAEFLRRRGYCCESGCRHCPYQSGDLHRSTSSR